MSGRQSRLDLFASNAQITRREFTWQDDSSKRLAGFLYAQAGKAVDCEAIRQCHRLIKQSAGVFSAFRGDMAICLAALLSLSPNPLELLSQTLKVHGLLKGVKLHDSDFLVMAAYQIAVQAGPEDYTNAVARTRSFYDGMKARRLFRTGQDDYVLAAMLGLTNLDVAAGVERIEQFYGLLKGEFRNKNSVQALAQVLVLSNSKDSVVNRILALRDATQAQKLKLDKAYTLPILGVLALLPVEIDTIVRDLSTAQAALRSQKGFGPLSIDAEELLLFVASITASGYAVNTESRVLAATLSTSVANIIIAQQAAIMTVCIGAASTNAAASS